jgi:hypothetical protein
MAVYDDDEENPPVGFEQDPESDDIGDGYWTYADGSRKYASGDPGDAKKLMKAAPPPPPGPEEQKGLGSQGPYSASAAAAIPAPSPLQGTSPIGPSADQEFLNSTTGAEADEERDLSAPAPSMGEASERPKPLQALTAPRMPGAGGPARYTDSTGSSASQSASQSDQQSVQHTGSAQDRGEFEQGQRDIDASYGQQKTAIDQGTQGVVGALQRRQQAIAQMGADKEAATTGAMASAALRQKQVTDKIVEVGSRKTDHNKMWKDKGILGTTLGLLGVALRSLTATKFGGPNTAMQSLQEQRKQNLQAQMEDRDSELRGLEKELGSIEAAAPMLEARMNDALSKRIDAMMVDEKSATVLANAQQMKAQLDTESAQKKAEAAKAYAGTIAKQQSQSSQLSQQQGTEQSRQRLSGAGVGGEGGPKRMTPREIAEADQAWEEQGVPQEQRARLWTENGYEAPGGKTAAEYKRDKELSEAGDKRNEQEGKAQAAADSVNSFGQKAGLTRDPKTGEWVVGDGIAPPGFWESVDPFSDNAVSAEAENAVEAYGRLQSGGVIGPEERKAFRDQLGLNTGNRKQLAARLNAAERSIRARQPTDERKKGSAVPGNWKSKPPEATP